MEQTPATWAPLLPPLMDLRPMACDQSSAHSGNTATGPGPCQPLWLSPWTTSVTQSVLMADRGPVCPCDWLCPPFYPVAECGPICPCGSSWAGLRFGEPAGKASQCPRCALPGTAQGFLGAVEQGAAPPLTSGCSASAGLTCRGASG